MLPHRGRRRAARPERLPWHPPCRWRPRCSRRRRPARIFPRWSGICSRSPARSRRCSAPTASSNRSPRSAPSFRKSAPPSPTRCRAARYESIENEIRSLSRRIDDTRQSGTDGLALAGIERALSDIREVLRSLTPAEQLAGYDDAIRNLGGKLDLILRANDDPSTIQQLEGAISALRGIVSNVASNDALARLSDDVHTLSSKVDQLARREGNGNSFASLEARIAALTSSLETRERPADGGNTEHLEGALRALSDRFDRMPVGNDNASAFAHLEQRVSYLLERIETSSEPRSGNLGRVEDALQDILRHLESQHAAVVALTENNRNTSAPQPFDGGVADMVKREMSDIRFSQSETDRRTQDSLEAVHNTLGHVVDRLAMIEGDLRTVRASPVATQPQMPPAPQPEPPQAAAPRVAMPPQPKPELPNPAAAQEHFVTAPREFQAVQAPALTAVTPRAISEILEPYTAPRPVIAPDLPHDHPLEPGTRPTARAATPSERIANSESAISEIPTGSREPVSTSSFIAAARRAAQAAAAAPPAEKSSRGPFKGGASKAKDPNQEPSTITSKIRSLLVGASVVVIVLGTFKMAMTLLDSGSPPPMPAVESSTDQAPAAQPPAEETVRPAAPTPAIPSMTSPTPIGRQSFNNPAPGAPDGTATVAIPQAAPIPAASPAPAGDITSALPAQPVAPASRKLTPVQIPPTERLPDAIGGPALRAAALKGDPTAAYEIGVRFAEGKGVAANYDDAAKWYDRAAQAGVVPAIFRLGTLYEKGLSVKKDIDIARRYYMQAAERGSAKAMHNLAVLDADGGGKGANYKNASQWFRKAADRGIADSQFNLGILYARGIGVEQNLAEVLQMVQPGRGTGRRGFRSQTRRCRQAARRPVAGGGQARDPDLHGGAPARRRRQRGDPGRRLGRRSVAGLNREARGQAGFDQARRRAISRIIHHSFMTPGTSGN